MQPVTQNTEPPYDIRASTLTRRINSAVLHGIRLVLSMEQNVPLVGLKSIKMTNQMCVRPLLYRLHPHNKALFNFNP